MIFHVSSVYPPKLGGIEKVVRVLARTQARLKTKVSVITSDQGMRGVKVPTDTFPVKRLKSFVFANTTIMPGLFFALLKVGRNDVAHVHLAQAYTPEVVWLASKIKRFPYIAHVHLDVPPSGPAGFLLKYYKSIFLKRVLRAAASVVVFTEDQKQEIYRKYKVDTAKIMVVPNGVEEDFYASGSKALHKKPRLLFVGRLGYQKNLPQLLHALDGISDQFETTIVGDGELSAELKALTKNLKLKNVNFAGRADGKKLQGYYKRSDIFVLPSEREGMPLVLLEAMAMGLPIVATDVTGNRDVVEEGKNGLLVPYNDAKAFRETLLKITSDKKLYAKMSRTSRKMAKQYSWEKVAARFEEAYGKSKDTLGLKKLKLWHVYLPLLAIANLAYLPKNFLGWIITLGFFLFVPGYLLLNTLRHEVKSRWEIASFSLGLSLLLLMVGGLLLNSLHAFGLDRPLTTTNIFAALDVITLALLWVNRKAHLKLPKIQTRPSIEQAVAAVVLTALPLLATAGAFRLNNGASNILTMILFALIPVVFVTLICRKNLKPLYPYAVFMLALAVLFSTSLRGWSITGHDINHEFKVFQAASNKGFWQSVTSSGDPYNACLSITILPAMLAKITTIAAPYIYKVVFQIIFAWSVLPVYFLIKRFSSSKLALIASFVFISFPTFLNDMPFLNRQEIAFVFFGLLLLATFSKMGKRLKTILTICCLLGLVLSHYSSNYVTLIVLSLAWVFYKLLARKRTGRAKAFVPLLSLPVLLLAFLMTFVWNVQITKSTSNLRSTVTNTVKGLEDGSVVRAGNTKYSLFAPTPTSRLEEFEDYASKTDGQAQYVPPADLPLTLLGKTADRVINIQSFNDRAHALIAKVLQVLVLVGVGLFLFKSRRKASEKKLYFYALTFAGVTLLILLTILPQLSVDYDVARLFQQALIVLALPIIVAARFLLSLFGRFKTLAAALLFSVLFLNLSGFMPQLVGGYQPQLTLNNTGPYYDFFYVHKGDALATGWLANNRDENRAVTTDVTSGVPPIRYPVTVGFLDNKNTSGYLYQSYVSSNKGVYRAFSNGALIEYTYPTLTNGRSLLYANQGSKIYEGRRTE